TRLVAKSAPARELLQRISRDAAGTQEWIDGFPVVELLRARRRLEIDEALPMLEQIADAIDFAAHRELARLDLGVNAIVIAFPGGLDKARREELLRTKPIEWPKFRMKIDACVPVTGPFESTTWNGELT